MTSTSPATEDNVHLILDLVDDFAALVHRVGDGPALKVLGVPAGDVGRDHADDADLDAALVDDGVAIRQRLALGAVDVAGQDFALLESYLSYARRLRLVVLVLVVTSMS